MKRLFFALVVGTVCMTLVEVTLAQGVPSAVAILPTTPPSTNTMESSDRYEKRTTTKSQRKTYEEVEKVETKTQLQVPPSPEVVRPLDQATSMVKIVPSLNEESEEEATSVGESMRDMIVGGSSDEVDRYRSYLGPDDIRRNRVELLVAPMFIYNESKSEYYYRNYFTATPGGHIGLNVWFTPFFGVATSYEKSFLGTLKKDVSGASQTPYLDQWLQIGLRFRRYSSFSSLSPSLTIGLDYSEYQRKVPLDELRHTKLTTAGLLISAESRIPSSETLSWILGLEYMPIVNHQEIATAGDIKSGTKVDTLSMGFSVGAEIKLNRANRLFFKLKDRYEKNSFTGTANVANPYTGETPENVSVTNNFIFFEIGYIWGN